MLALWFRFMQIVKLSEYEAYMMGGYSSRHGASTHNWWLWSPESWRFEDRDLYMYRSHEAGAFTRIPEDAAIIRKCQLN